MISFQNLVYFVTIATQGSFNKAARLLFLSQSSLSKSIANLEKDLNATLFERNQHGVQLTDDGKKLYQYATTVLEQVKLIEGISTQTMPKVLRVASYPLPAISTTVAQFYNRHLEDHVDIRFYECRVQKVLDSVIEGNSDIGIITANAAQKNKLKNVLRYNNLEATLLGQDTWYVVVGPLSPLYNRESVNIRELVDIPIVRFFDDFFSNLTYYLEIDGVQLTSVKHAVFVNDNLDIQNFLLQTNTFYFQLGINAPYYTARGLHFIPVENFDLSIDVVWVKQKNVELSAEAKEFVSLLEGLYQKEKP